MSRIDEIRAKWRELQDGEDYSSDSSWWKDDDIAFLLAEVERLSSDDDDVLAQRDHREEQVTAIHDALGCEREWSNLHDCGECAQEQAEALAAEVERLTKTINEINAIRDRVIGSGTVNWSEHVYPLVAALNEGGFKGADYPVARENFGTVVERLKRAESEVERLTKEYASLTVDRDQLHGELVSIRALRADKNKLAAALDAVLAVDWDHVHHAFPCAVNVGFGPCECGATKLHAAIEAARAVLAEVRR